MKLDPAALAICRASLAAKSRSFSLAARLLPRETREPIAVIYAWCRRCDDAIDEVPAADQSRALSALRAEVEAIYGSGELADPVPRLFREVVRYYGIPRLYIDELLEGMAMDVCHVPYTTYAELTLYCYRVAGTVGLMLCHVLGINDPSLLDSAAHLGMAMQLTNVCRDVAEDAERGRRYVPSDRSPRDLLRDADRYYASADKGILALGMRSALAIRLARLVYAAIGEVIAERGYDVWRGRAVVSGVRKLVLVVKAIVVTMGELPQRLRNRAALVPPPRTVRFEDVVLLA